MKTISVNTVCLLALFLVGACECQDTNTADDKGRGAADGGTADGAGDDGASSDGARADTTAADSTVTADGAVADSATADSATADSTAAVDGAVDDASVTADAAGGDSAVVAAHCADSIHNGDETGVDCGGSCPMPFCCYNGHLDSNLGETGVDCGGACQNCALKCFDGVKNRDETGVDCGGSCSADCCSNGYYDSDNGETGLDCGGSTCTACSGGQTYFVANDGDDNALGTSPATAWQTIAEVNGRDFQAGDAILFKRGDVWREKLVINDSGESGNHITFGNYGEGPRPRILGSDPATGWTRVGSGQVWQSATIGRPYDEANAPYGKWSSIFFVLHNGDTAWGRVQPDWDGIERTNVQPTCGNNYALLQQEYDWCWENDRIYVYAATNPGDRYISVEVPHRASAIAMPSHDPQQYITIDGFELMYATRKGYDDGWPMAYEVSGLTIQNCHIAYIGIPDAADGMGMAIWHSDMVVRNNVIHDTGRRNISYNIYNDNGRTGIDNLIFENVLVEGNMLYHGLHTTGLDISSDGGSSGAHGDILRNFTIRNNFIWDDPGDDPQDHPNDYTSMGIYLLGESADFINFQVYNNILKHIKQKVVILHSVQDSAVYNNTFYSMNERAGVVGTGSEYRGVVNVSGTPSGLSIDNNIFYGDVDTSQYRLRHIVFSTATDASGGIVSLNRNVYFHLYPEQDLIAEDRGYNTAEWQLYQQSGLGWDLDSPNPGDPLLTNPEGGDFRPSVSTSPAVNMGAVFVERTTDFLGNPIQGTPDIGAVEFQ